MIGWSGCGSARRLISKDSIARCGRLQSAPNTTLLVAGIAPDSKEAIQAGRLLARKALTDVRFLGFREDIPELMAAADVLVHPSRLDVTGQVILEAS